MINQLHCFQVASWGAYLLKKNVLTMSFAPRDTHISQVQFALERGVPAILGVMAENRMPYPARSFDMAHCSRCLIPWAKYGNFIISLGLKCTYLGLCRFQFRFDLSEREADVAFAPEQ